MVDTAALVDAGTGSWFADSVDRLVRGAVADLDPFLIAVGGEIPIEGTQATFRCHFVRKDANGRPRVKELAKKLAEQAIDYCIPRSRIDEARRHFELTRSTDRFVRLSREATELFTALERSGEGGELLLFLMLERILGIPQLLCKMSLKTNSEMHVHGTDGVHVRALDNGRLGLYWCESKLYDDAQSAIRACFDSIAPFLLDEGDGAARRDLLLVRDHLDTGDEVLDELLVRYFIEDSLESTMREVRGASLIGFSLADYPSPFLEDGSTILESVGASIEDWIAGIERRVGFHSIADFCIDVFCLPVPSVSEFRDALREELART